MVDFPASHVRFQRGLCFVAFFGGGHTTFPHSPYEIYKEHFREDRNPDVYVKQMKREPKVHCRIFPYKTITKDTKKKVDE